MRPAPVAILTGMTATGKSDVALQFAESHPEIEIINADSIQIFRQMNIGSAKPTAQEQARVPHHLLDIRNPDQPFSAGDFRRRVDEIFSELSTRGKRALIVGGTGFYLKALLYGLWQSEEAEPAARAQFRNSIESLSNEEMKAKLSVRDPVSALRIATPDRYRLIRSLEVIHFTGKTPTELEGTMPRSPDPRFSLLVLDRLKDELDSRIVRRTESMLSAGFVDEVRNLTHCFPGARPLLSVGYAQVVAHLEGRLPAGRKASLNEESLALEINLATRQLCKRQRTWFRSEESAEWFTLDGQAENLKARLEEIYTP